MALTVMRPERGLGEGAGGVAVEGRPGFRVDLGFEGGSEGLVGVVRAEEVGVADEEALLVVVGVDEPAGDPFWAVRADFAGVRVEAVHTVDPDLDAFALFVFGFRGNRSFKDFDVRFAEDDEESARRRLSTIFRVGWPPGPSSQCRLGYLYGELRIGLSKNRPFTSIRLPCLWRRRPLPPAAAGESNPHACLPGLRREGSETPRRRSAMPRGSASAAEGRRDMRTDRTLHFACLVAGSPEPCRYTKCDSAIIALPTARFILAPIRERHSGRSR